MSTTVSAPPRKGYFGEFGGQFVPDTLIPVLAELEAEYLRCQQDPVFQSELAEYLQQYAGRPTPLQLAKRFSEALDGPRIYLKREDLLHTGAHKLNHALGQGLLTKRMGKQRVICETGAGQHGVATATVCAQLGLDCEVYMGAVDCERQYLNVQRMKLLGAQVHAVESGSRTLRDAINEAMRDWVATYDTTNYIFGTVAGPHPFPLMVRDFQSVIGNEAYDQFKKQEPGKLPSAIFACVGGGSNAMGIFHRFVEEPSVKLIGCEAGGESMDLGKHASTLTFGKPGILHGAISYLLQDADGNVWDTHSVSAGLDYPGVGPEHSYLKALNRASYISISDTQALEGVRVLARHEGIIPALETAHAVAGIIEMKDQFGSDDAVIVNVSGRGDKDMNTIAERLGDGVSK